METIYTRHSIFNPRDKLSERKEELIREREAIKKMCSEIYKDKTKEISRQMQICLTKKWKNKNPVAVSAQKKRRYLWLKETDRLRNILL